MSELIQKKLAESKGKKVLIFLNNNFRYEGKITDFDNTYIELLDYKKKMFKLILIKEIKEMEVLNDK